MAAFPTMRSMAPADITRRSQEVLADSPDLAWYAVDPALPVRMQLAARPDLPDAVAVRLARDPAVEVRALVLRANPHPEVVTTLVRDPHPGIARAATRCYTERFVGIP